MTIIVEGQKIASLIKEGIKKNLEKTGPKTLAIFYVGSNKVIDRYVNLKEKIGQEIGIGVRVFRLPENISQRVLIEEIQKADKEFSGVIVQLPLPENLDKREILDAVSPSKDVDMLSSKAYNNFKDGTTKRLPPVVGALKEIIEKYNIDIHDKNIAVVGQGLLVGRPITDWLKRNNYSYEVFDDKTEDLFEALKSMDVIISGVGKSNLITPNMIKEGVILIDAGSSTSDGKLVGDIDKACYDKASIVSGVPGGVGPITVVNLFRNLFLE
jgi:methylenetetrahydrofolate dehydrogenase (NADP+)/methenyltetrahydrofolate cyclohydrolase